MLYVRVGVLLQIMDTYHDELIKLLRQNHTLMRSCGIALTAANVTLSQQLLKLKNTIATDPASVFVEDGELRGMGGVCEGMSHRNAAGEVSISVEVFKSGRVDDETDGYGLEVGEEMQEADMEEKKELKDTLKLHATETIREREPLSAGVTPPLSGIIESNSEFPSGPYNLSSYSTEEPDLDSTLSREEEEVNRDEASCDRAADSWSISDAVERDVEGNVTEAAVVVMGGGGGSFSGAVYAVDVRRSQSRAIPEAVVGYDSNSRDYAPGCSPVGGSGPSFTGGTSSLEVTVGHTSQGTSAEDSKEGSAAVGRLFSFGGSGSSLNIEPPVSSLESQKGLDYLAREATSSRTRQMTLASSKEDDRIAVPVVTRSHSIG